MSKWLVESGEMHRVVEADDPDQAAAEAVAQENSDPDPGKLGLIMSVVEVVDGEIWYMNSETACRKAGCWAGS